MNELRFYVFINFMLSSIQQGIQSFHVCHEMFMKYQGTTPENKLLHDWATKHKTMICLNGGANQDILEKYLFLTREVSTMNFPLPFAAFNEDQYSLGGLMTGVGLVIPEEIYAAVDYQTACKLVDHKKLKCNELIDTSTYYFVKDGEIVQSYLMTSPEWKLISILKACPLAR